MSSSSSPCAACKLLRRKCTQGCVFAPYFPPDQPARFANVHKVFGASNVSKLLNDLPVPQREDAVNSLAYEAEARLRDPVYGCVAYISVLQVKIKQVREEIANARKELAGYIGQAAYAPLVPGPGMHHPAMGHGGHHYGAGMGLHPLQAQQQHMAALQNAPHQYQQQLHQQQIVEAQNMAAAAEVAAGRGQHQQDMMMMRQGYAPHGAAGGGPTVAIVPPGPGSADPAAYDGAQAQSFLIQQQPTPSALTTFRVDQSSPPPQSSGHSHVDMSHAPQHHHRQQHTDAGSDEGSGAPRRSPDDGLMMRSRLIRRPTFFS